MLAVCRHWEGAIEMNKLCVGIEPVGLAGLVGFTLGAKHKKAWAVAPVSALGPSSAGRCSCALRCNNCTHCPTDLIVAAVFREKGFYCWLF